MKKKFLKAGVIAISFIMLTLSFTGCKSKQKAAQERSASAEAAYNQKIEQAKRDLLSIINDQGTMSLDEKEYRLNAIKQQNFPEQEIKDLILLAEEKISALKAKNDDTARKESENQEQYVFRKSMMDSFNAIANASSFSQANTYINQALKLFASADVPVLIIISQENGIKDYDRPTTIKKYLEYLKDVKNFDTKIETFVLDNNGKITELELIKK